MTKNNSLSPDFGLYLKNNFGYTNNSNVIITDSFIIANLIMFPDKKSTITAEINEKFVSFDFEDNILKIFLKILKGLKVFNHLSIENEIRERQNQPVSFYFNYSPVLVTGMVLSCKFGRIEKSKTTNEEFLPLIIESAKIVQQPVAVLL